MRDLHRDPARDPVLFRPDLYIHRIKSHFSHVDVIQAAEISLVLLDLTTLKYTMEAACSTLLFV